MIEDFDVLGKILSEKENPETFHINNRTHPGPYWWLKTVCPHPDYPELDFYKITPKWLILSDELPNLVFIDDVAFDWDGNIIAKTASVWLSQAVDALIFTIKTEAFIQLMNRQDGESLIISNLKSMFSKKEQYTDNEQSIITGIDNLSVFWEEIRSSKLRDNFKVVK